MPNQRVATNSLIESTGGAANRPTFSTQRLSPSAGSITIAPPTTTQLVAVDYQTTTFAVSALGNGSWLSVTWPGVGFTGLLSAEQRYYTSFTQTTGSSTSTTANNTNPLVTGQSTQLGLLCSVASVVTTTGVYVSTVNIKTQATDTAMPVPIIGPWFPTGMSYTGFSCVANAGIFNNTGGAFTGNVTLGITAQLYAVFVQ